MSAHGNISRADKPFPWWRLYAPPPLSRMLVVDALLLVPAIAGALSGWPWGITMALLIPGLAAASIFGSLAARARGIRSRPRRPTVTMTLIWAAVLFAVLVVTEGATPRYIMPLVFVVLLILVLVPVWHAMWRRLYEE